VAGIDKTYVPGKEYKIYREWWIANYDKMMEELGRCIWLYPFALLELDAEVEPTPRILATNKKDLEWVEAEGEADVAIWSTSYEADLWLIKNCPIASYQERMVFVYDAKNKEDATRIIEEQINCVVVN